MSFCFCFPSSSVLANLVGTLDGTLPYSRHPKVRGRAVKPDDTLAASFPVVGIVTCFGSCSLVFTNAHSEALIPPPNNMQKNVIAQER